MLTFTSLGQANQMPEFRRVFMYLWEHELWNYEVRIFVLSITMDIDLDGTTDSTFLPIFKAFIKSLQCARFLTEQIGGGVPSNDTHHCFLSRGRKAPTQTIFVLGKA